MKILFFDIDGTLLDHTGRVSESTKRALQLAKEEGHLRLLCTGRTCSMLPPQVRALGFDGIVGGAGTYVQVGEEILLDRELTPSEVEASLFWLSKGRFGFLYEGRDCVHVMPWEHYQNARRYQEHVRRIGAPYEVIDLQHPEQIHTAKFSVTMEEGQWDYGRQMIEALKESFHVVIHQAPRSRNTSAEPGLTEAAFTKEGQGALTDGLAEFLPNGCDKAAGIRIALDYLNIPVSEAYAFGDSNNDLEMLRLVEHSVCMGNGTREAKAAAEYSTTDIGEDGIWNAMLHYGLITEKTRKDTGK